MKQTLNIFISLIYLTLAIGLFAFNHPNSFVKVLPIEIFVMFMWACSLFIAKKLQDH